MDEDEKNEEPDFSAFADWHVTEQEERWPATLNGTHHLTYSQKNIIQRNAQLLSNKKKWHEHVTFFELQLCKIIDEEARKKKRTEFIIYFDRYYFSHKNNDYSHFHFPCSISFTKARFMHGNVHFHKAQFKEGNISFDNVHFGKGNVVFDQAKFEKGNISFNEAFFDEGNISFINTLFNEGNVTFYKTQFGKGNVTFYNAQFGKGDVSFTNSQFQQGYVSFANAKLGNGNVSFRNTQFGEGELKFVNVQFGDGSVYFNNAQFEKGYADFHGVQFGSGNVYFDRLSIKKTNIRFSYNIIKGLFSIKNVTFPQEATFNSLTFEGSAFFSGCKFKETPNFRDTIFERPIEISNIKIPTAEMNSHWLSPKAVNKEDVHKYRKLKSMAQDTHDHIMEGYFFAQEMRAKRGVEITSFGELLLNQLYYVFSNYGQSYWRPLIGLLGSFAAFMAFYFLLFLFFIKPVSALPFAAEYSLRHTLPFIGTFLRFSPYPPDHPSWFSKTLHHLAHEGAPLGWMAYIGLVQSILGLILLFLLALGLRNAFRMK